ncbi:uncharacterized protein [Misgurnus anguillicaudatus]|uniref:uncharacterized protein n=1 Tax=Misgurnus anguillicaudatus TaxID=75329 RepID=UPI003CCF3CB1
MEEALPAILQAQTTLNAAVTELCRRTETQGRKPQDYLTKMTREDDVETYLDIFEKTAQRERWPRADWANLILPLLTGEAQKACRDLTIHEATNYDVVKRAILAQYGLSLPAKAQRIHSWEYHATLPARAQVTSLTRMVRSWLEEGDGPPAVERVVIDRCIRGLPADAKKYVAQQGPQNVDTLIALIENHQVTVSLLKPEGNKTLTWKSRQEREPPKKYPEVTQAKPLRAQGNWKDEKPLRNPVPFRCFTCGREGHLARECPGREELMPTASASESSRLPCHFLTTCWAHERAAAPKIPVKIGGHDTEALIDSGSMVTLIRPEYAGPTRGREITVSCIHGDSRNYQTAEVSMVTPRGQFQLQAGVVDHLPVPVLVGRDCQAFSAYWTGQDAERKRPTRRRRRDRLSTHRCPLTTEEITDAEATSPEEPLNKDEEILQQGKLGRFGSAQLQDPSLSQAWGNVQVIDGRLQDGVSGLTYPHFMIKNKLLYRVEQ